MDATGRGQRILNNVLWSWAAVAVSLVAGFFVSPYTVRKLGHEGYGIWVLVFSLIEYYWLLDLGFRSATVKYSAHYRALNQPDKINEIVNTGLAYYSVVAIVLMGATVLLSNSMNRFFQLSPGMEHVLPPLIIIVGLSWALGSVFNVFNACLEGFQRFDLASRIWIVSTGFRSIGSLVLLALGFGLIGLSLLVVASQLLAYLMSYFSFRRIFPEQRFSYRLARLSAMRQMASYGFHTALASVATRLLGESVPLMIGHFRPVAFAGYYNLPVRLMQYSTDAITRVGLVTGSNAAELCAQGDLKTVGKMGVYANRYCLILFMPLVLFLLAYGHELIQVWIGPEFAAHSAPLLPVLAVSMAVAMAGQFNSSAILYGLGKHSGYARGLLVEAILTFASLLVVIPRYGILGAAWVTSILMILNRGIYTPWLLCRSVGASYADYMRSIYLRPLALAVPVLASLFALKLEVRGTNWFGLLAAAALSVLAYFGLALVFGFDKEHRDLVAGRLKASYGAWFTRRRPGLSPRGA